MVEPQAADEARIAETVARLLARQAALLARAAEDGAAAFGARLGLSWLSELLRSFNVTGASDWFLALRARAGPGEGRTSAAWPLVGAPLCEALAGEVRRAGTLAPLEGTDWSARVAELLAYVEPAPQAEAVPEAAPAPEPGPGRDPFEEAAAELELPPANPDESHAELFEAIADFAGAERPGVDARHGRVEIAGSRTLPEGGMDAASALLLRALDRAARAAGAVLLAETQGGALAWRVRLPRPEARHYLFVERSQASFAVPWNRVVEYGLTSGGERLRVLLGSGLERIELPVSWLFGKGEGTPAPAESGEPAVEVPERFGLGGWVADADGGIARVLDLENCGDPPIEPAEPAPNLQFEDPGPADGTPEAVEAVQPEALPADNDPETGRVFTRVTRALVADDSMMARVFLGRLLAQRGIEVDEAEDGVQAQAALMARTFDLVFLDADMPGMGAREILEAGGAELAARVCVLVKDDEERRRAEAFGAGPILYKPFAEDEVRSAVDALLARVPPGD